MDFFYFDCKHSRILTQYELYLNTGMAPSNQSKLKFDHTNIVINEIQFEEMKIIASKTTKLNRVCLFKRIIFLRCFTYRNVEFIIGLTSIENVEQIRFEKDSSAQSMCDRLKAFLA